MHGLIWTASARSDLADIDDHLLELGAGPAAVRILGAVRAAADRLRDHPAIGRSIANDLRVWQLLYTIEKDDVAILRVLHERRNWRDDRSSFA